MKNRVKTTIVRPVARQVNKVTEIAIAIAAFVALYLTLITSLPLNGAYYAALPIGAAAAALSMLFYDKKYAKFAIFGGAVLITVIGVAIFKPFGNGLLTFLNGAIKSINSTRHAGYPSFAASESFGASFLFAIVVCAWLAVFSAISARIPHLYACVSAAALFVLLLTGLYPHYFAAVFLVLVCVCTLALHAGFYLKAIVSYLTCALVLSAALAPCLLFGGSAAVDRFRDDVSDAFDSAVYGYSIPNGKLADSYGMSSSTDVRLNVTLSRLTPSLYLRGFVGSELNGSRWVPTDKNAYVENGYQGLLDYIGGDLPIKQYAEYSNFNVRNNHYSVTVENLSADRRYVYAPYSISRYSYGSAYYDLGLRAGAFPKQTYSYTVFNSDESSERITQAPWVLDDVNRTEAMAEYIALEGQYRAFVYDTYLNLGGAESEVNAAVGSFDTTSINTATQYIRAYFLDSYSYADESDRVGDDFAAEFFGGSIKKGNSAYFASAATLMFRAMGFPARYVEGYTVFADMQDLSETVTVAVTGESTHAWTEVYFDGIGFLPIEVTPTFFTEQPPEVVVDPTDPGISGTTPPPSMGEPETPSDEQPENPDVPPGPTDDPPQTENAAKPALLSALEVLVPVAAAVASLLFIALAFAFRRIFVRARRRKLLGAQGEQFGRAAYSIMVRDCKYFGGFDGAMLARLGVDEGGTNRFVRIAEQCVYGKHEVTATEREFVLWYISAVHDALLSSCSLLRSLYLKFVVCVVI